MGGDGCSLGGSGMTRIDCGSITLDHDIHGSDGPWLLAIQGLGYARWGWNRQVPEFAKHFRVITFDNRGVGGSDAPEGPYTAAQMADDAAALLGALGVQRAHVMGVSLGGFIAQALAVEHPELIERLVLVATGMGGPSWVPMPEVTVRLLADFPSLDSHERFLRSTRNGFTEAFADAHPHVIDEFVALREATAQPFEHWMWQNNAGATFDLSARVGKIDHPVLVLQGMNDNVVDYRNAKLLADALPNARLAELPGGHLLMIEDAGDFNERVVSFLKQDI